MTYKYALGLPNKKIASTYRNVLIDAMAEHMNDWTWVMPYETAGSIPMYPYNRSIRVRAEKPDETWSGALGINQEEVQCMLETVSG
ncbi:hypothetical protein HBH56_107440 [Parastagonospora nodorum]|nr:hypothetical protein SNOG_10826 [Parastagonospora nodorum SN15]KAH3913765.1 hypothetical protein HBH56_107440 [Parastagonospora nodorum]EAT82220.1 hypothetical protein SNOG_10826 [Parastagonospora nodorum SN15]KAH3929507.1 hypothetical protein HBH54_122980 [Parastagonospora nodorum]KAH4067473.1 hypothetical protein HBH50_127640 [Parastagonospora nodorum]KAH4086572.1 hypothetical protein HBH48_137060 [Parastagonospora nodorum]